MRTVLTYTAGDYQIVKAFDCAVIDPIKTARSGSAAYFDPKPGEYMIDSKDYEFLSELLRGAKQGELVTLQGEVISVFDTMTPEQIEAFKAEAKAAALVIAARERSKLEIAGDSEALEKTRDWYKNRIDDIERLYGVAHGK